MKNKKQLLFKVLLLIGIIAAVTGIVLGILLGTGVIKYDNGFVFNTELFNSVKNEIWFRFVFILIQVAITTLLCFVPATSMMFIIGGVALFGANWTTFLTCFGGVLLSSFSMDAIGRFGGAKLVIKLIGQDAYDTAYKLVNEKGLVYIPFMYLLPIFPDDAICCVCGVMKIKWWLHYLFILTCRGVGCATIVFGLTLIPYQNFTTFYEWFIFITCCLVWVVAILFICNKLNKRLEKKRKIKENKNMGLDATYISEDLHFQLKDLERLKKSIDNKKEQEYNERNSKEENK